MPTEPPPRVSIIVPAWNAAAYLGETIAGVQAQTVSHWELLLVDDGSTDDTGAIARAFAAGDSRIRAIRQENAGASAARNRGFAESHSAAPFVAFLDADDVWEPNALATLGRALDAAPPLAAAYGLARAIDGAGVFLEPDVLEAYQRERWGIDAGCLVRWPSDKPTTFAVEAVMEHIITAGTALLRRNALEAAGLFDPQLSMWEDWDLWLRLCKVGDMAFIDHPVLRYRRHGGNVSNQVAAREAGERQVRQKLLHSLAGDAERLRVAQRGARAYHKIVAGRRWRWATGCLRQGKPLEAVKQMRHAARWYAGALWPPAQVG